MSDSEWVTKAIFADLEWGLKNTFFFNSKLRHHTALSDPYPVSHAGPVMVVPVED